MQNQTTKKIILTGQCITRPTRDPQMRSMARHVTGDPIISSHVIITPRKIPLLLILRIDYFIIIIITLKKIIAQVLLIFLFKYTANVFL